MRERHDPCLAVGLLPQQVAVTRAHRQARCCRGRCRRLSHLLKQRNARKNVQKLEIKDANMTGTTQKHTGGGFRYCTVFDSRLVRTRIHKHTHTESWQARYPLGAEYTLCISTEVAPRCFHPAGGTIGFCFFPTRDQLFLLRNKKRRLKKTAVFGNLFEIS